jgi:hypothetical protein
MLTPMLEDELLDAAIDRLAHAELSATVLVNNRIYQLLKLAVEPGRLQATVTLLDFATYALTMDLLEAELVDTLADVASDTPATLTRARPLRLPLRDARLPSVTHALDFEHRVCAGGPVALLAAARPRGRAGQWPADYALLVQERSPRVLNVVGKLAVIPKAFHGPTVEPLAEADLSTSVHRELEGNCWGATNSATSSTKGCGRSTRSIPTCSASRCAGCWTTRGCPASRGTSVAAQDWSGGILLAGCDSGDGLVERDA